MKNIQISQAKPKTAPIPIPTAITTYPHPAAAFAPEVSDGCGEPFAELGVFCEFTVVAWTTVDVVVLELEVEFLYICVVVVVPVKVEDAAEEADGEDWDNEF